MSNEIKESRRVQNADAHQWRRNISPPAPPQPEKPWDLTVDCSEPPPADPEKKKKNRNGGPASECKRLAIIAPSPAPPSSPN